ncbi:GapA-binding peptide SR1P [Bacillus taeanensis]
MTYKIGIDSLNVTYYYRSNLNKTFSKNKGDEKMGTIVCQKCDATISHFEDEKVTKLYAQCPGCHDKNKQTKR